MTTVEQTRGAAPPADAVGTNEKILFWASFLTLIAAGIGFAVRGAVLADWGQQFGFTKGELGGITGGGLVGFGITILLCSFLADRLGYGRLMALAFLLHFSSAVVTLAATPVFNAGLGKGATYWCLYVGMFLFALGNGTCEAVINPLTADLYPRNKTHWLNILHAGWPLGLVLGALLELAFGVFSGMPWEVKMSVFLVPVVAYGVLMLGRKFPVSHASAASVTLREMMQELGLLGAAVVCVLLGIWFGDVLAGFNLSPVIGWGLAAGLLVVFGSYSNFRLGHWMLALLLVIHAMVGYVELGTDSWITNITGTILSNKNFGLMLFVWTSGLMFVLRFFAGPIVHRISPVGLLFASACLGCTGLLLLGHVEGVVMCVLAATVYGFGKTFLWPTMLGVVSERFPRGGALTLGAVGGVGMLSAGLLGGPGIGYKQDRFASEYLQEKDRPAYERYASDTEKSFLEFRPVRGLDGAKVAILADNGQQLQTDIKNFENKGGQLSQNPNLSALNTWWETTGKPNAAKDKEPVMAAGLVGGQQALTYTAAIPAAMAVCYLLLLGYFRAKGGYTAKVLTGHAAEDERFTGGVVGPAGE